MLPAQKKIFYLRRLNNFCKKYLGDTLSNICKRSCSDTIKKIGLVYFFAIYPKRTKLIYTDSKTGAIQNTLQAQAAHSVNLALTSRNWLMGCYIVEFEQHGENRAAYGEQLLKKLEKWLNTKGLNDGRFREFRRLYHVYPQLKEEDFRHSVHF